MSDRAQLVFFSGTMDSGKSTLALQMDHNQAVRGRVGRIFTSQDRAGAATLSSRLGLQVPANEVAADLDLWAYIVDELQHGARIDYLICDEAQFYSRDQVDQLARIVDDLGIDVLAFGLLTDFRTRLFAGSARLIELADRWEPVQVEALCWCGARATHNARTIGGVMVTHGAQVLVGDLSEDPTSDQAVAALEYVRYEVLCRRHHRRRMTAAAARSADLSPDVLPFDRAR